jgi:glycerophosphoryl diester phosphodiesterase
MHQHKTHNLFSQKGINTAGPIIFGHRGFPKKAPENTLASLLALKQAGFSAVEFDVRICKTGEVVVSHDASLLRVSGQNLSIADEPLDSLRQVDIGSWFHPDFSDQRLPLLSEFLETAGPEFIFDIELKEETTSNVRLAQAVGTLIYRHNLAQRCIISSFNPFVLRQFARLWPDLPRGIIFSRHKDVPWFLRGGFGRVIARTQVEKPHVPQAIRNLSSPTGQKHPTLAWTVNTMEDAVRLTQLGAWGLIGDDPELIKKAVQETLQDR